jgi:peroxiredoxin
VRVALAALVVVLVAGCGGGERSFSYRPVDRGAPPAPDFTLPLLDGGRVRGDALWRERPAVLVFLSSWCSTCARQQPALRELADEYGGAVAFVGIAGQDEPGALEAFVERHDVGYPVGIDASLDIWRRYAVREPPAIVLVDRGGRLLRGWPGTAGADRLAVALDRHVVAN